MSNDTLTAIKYKLDDIEDLVYGLPLRSSIKSAISIEIDQLFHKLHDTISMNMPEYDYD